MVYSKISSERRKVRMTKTSPPNYEVEKTPVNKILERVENAKSPAVIIDGGAARYSWEDKAEDLVNALKIPAALTNTINFWRFYVMIGKERFIIDLVHVHPVERYLNGLHAPYNHVPLCDYGAPFKPFVSDVENQPGTFKVDKAAELDALFNHEDFNSADYPQVMDYLDAPHALKALYSPKE
ncbi:uncharacterized protein BCR38DRAFT_483024 [Pseudomassariella vexata]|uniref:Uncharacterized protein n=1 Tax=Pseudomassariella vexata TaxID=1141098 RepID=A0A1Y2E7J1_9PEZI|nr:uncharacterized protein BCR38DRAFT_483024 [Pseudomassariella vexata]ORY67407.1 hypothetical protein BCR38DRAFT_483024 [Pseudomassariella vexata]